MKPNARMIVILFFMCGAAGAASGLLVALAWGSAGMLFGFASPTPDQIMGLVGLMVCIGALGSAIIAGIVVAIEG